MDIFQEFISNDNKNLPKILDVFNQAEELNIYLVQKAIF